LKDVLQCKARGASGGIDAPLFSITYESAEGGQLRQETIWETAASRL